MSSLNEIIEFVRGDAPLDSFEAPSVVLGREESDVSCALPRTSFPDWDALEALVHQPIPCAAVALRQALRGAEPAFEPSLELFAWTSTPSFWMMQCAQFKRNDAIETTVALRYVTAELEHSLKQLLPAPVPPLLAQVCESASLVQLFGPTVCCVLSLLLGYPTGLNVRNLSWHGFLSVTDEHPRDILGALLAVVASLGPRLESARKTTSAPPSTPQQCACEPSRLKDPSPFFNYCSQELSHATFCTSRLVCASRGSLACLSRALSLYSKRDCYSALVLIWPEIERLCRIRFVSTNDEPCERLAPAKGTLFTTFDEMFASRQDNLFLHSLSRGTRELFFDLHSAPNGPRIRDTLSHGMRRNIQSGAEGGGEGDLGETLAAQSLALVSALVLDDSCEPLCVSAYRSHLHPASLLRCAAQACRQSVEAFASECCEEGEEECTVSFGVEHCVLSDCVSVLTFDEATVHSAELARKILTRVAELAMDLKESLVSRRNAYEADELTHAKRANYARLLAHARRLLCATVAFYCDVFDHFETVPHLRRCLTVMAQTSKLCGRREWPELLRKIE